MIEKGFDTTKALILDDRPESFHEVIPLVQYDVVTPFDSSRTVV